MSLLLTRGPIEIERVFGSSKAHLHDLLVWLSKLCFSYSKSWVFSHPKWLSHQLSRVDWYFLGKSIIISTPSFCFVFLPTNYYIVGILTTMTINNSPFSRLMRSQRFYLWIRVNFYCSPKGTEKFSPLNTFLRWLVGQDLIYLKVLDELCIGSKSSLTLSSGSTSPKKGA